MVQSLDEHFLSVLPQDMHIIPASLQVIKLLLQRLLLEIRLILNPLGTTQHQLLEVWLTAVNLILKINKVQC